VVSDQSSSWVEMRICIQSHILYDACMSSSIAASEDYCNRLAAIFREHDRLTELWTKGERAWPGMG